MKISTGLFDRMVLQRTARHHCDVLVSGQATTDGELRLRIGRQSWRGVGRVKRGRFQFRLTTLRTGGPYTIELEVRRGDAVVDRLTVREVLVGDVWIAAGQSNMQGCGLRATAAQPQPLVRAFYMNDRWGVARDPIHNMWDCVDQVHIDICGARPGKNLTHGVGPAVAFGQELQRLTGVPQGILACAHGGTSMAQWDPARKREGGKSLYGATIRRLHKNGGRVAGVIWYQGESDANPDAARVYTAKMRKLISAFRRDTRDPRLPFVLVQIARVLGWGPESGAPWNAVQDQQRLLPRRIRRVATVPAIDLTLDDLIHIGGPSNTRLGIRLANAMQSLRRGRGAPQPPLAIGPVNLETDPVTGLGRAVIAVENVHGRLQGGSRPVGFQLLNQCGPIDAIFDTVLDGARIILRCNLPSAQLADCRLQYGYGSNPVCNLTDGADRALPVFGPIPLGQPRAVTDFVRTWQVGPLLDGPELRLPKRLTSVGWRTLTAQPGGFASLRPEIAAAGNVDRVVCYRCSLRTTEPMKLAALLGYDGPIKLWIDGRRVFDDPHGTNPAVPGEARAVFRVGRGRHEVVLALGTNRGAAWGIFLQFERLDVPRALLRRGKDHYPMPVIE